MTKPANPFRRRAAREQFDKIVEMYDTRNKMLFRKDGGQNRGNAFATVFWGGYAGHTTGIFDYGSRESRQSAGYVFYRAGVAIAAREGNAPLGRLLMRIGWSVLEFAHRAKVPRSTAQRWMDGTARAPVMLLARLEEIARVIDETPLDV